MNKKRKQTLRAKAVAILRAHPEINNHQFALQIGKNPKHAASLMSVARKELGMSAWDYPTKPDKTMAMIHLGIPTKGRAFRDLLEVNDCRASELRKIARQRLAEGRLPSQDAIDWALSGDSTSKKPAEPEAEPAASESSASKRGRKKASRPALTTHSDSSGDVSVNSFQERKPRNPDDLIRAAGLDPEEWVIASQTVNTWEVGAKHPDTGQVLATPLYQTKIRLEPVGGAEGVMAAINCLIEDLRKNPPVLPVINHEKNLDGHMAEIAIPDLHLGKYASPNETGETYTPELACRIFRTALDDLLSQASKAYPLEKIIFPIGNDFLTSDTLANTTTRGTAQDVSGNFEAHFVLGFKLLREAIEKIRTIAPVDVVVVPGNHDAVASMAIGELLGAVYEGTIDVTVHHKTHQPRKYIQYGLNLLGYAHGNNERSQSLPMLMAQEAAQAWGSSRHREIHVGHLHHTKDTHYLGTNEVDGVIIRVIPSLSASDRWHASKGYRSQRAAQAMVYHPTLGHRAVFRHSILEALRIPIPSAA